MVWHHVFESRSSYRYTIRRIHSFRSYSWFAASQNVQAAAIRTGKCNLLMKPESVLILLVTETRHCWSVWNWRHWKNSFSLCISQDLARIASRYSDWLRAERSDDWGSNPSGGWEFFLRHRIQIGSGVHPASCPMGTGGTFREGKAAGMWSWPLNSIQCRCRMRGVYLHSPIRLHGVVLS